MRHAVQVVMTTTVTYVIEGPDVAGDDQDAVKKVARDLEEWVRFAHELDAWPEGCVQRTMVKQPARVEYLLGHPELRYVLTRGDEGDAVPSV